MLKTTSLLCAFCGVLCGLAATSTFAAETGLSERRVAALKALDAHLATDLETAAYPTPNLSLAQNRDEQSYYDKAGAIFGLVACGAAPEVRLKEANSLLRYAMLGKYVLSNAKQVEGDSGIWMHRSRTLGMRLYALYRDRMAPDIRTEYEKRLNWLARAPYERSSENIKLTNNSSYFLAHEFLGREDTDSYRACEKWLIDYLRNHGTVGTHEWGSSYNSWTYIAVLNLAEFSHNPRVRDLAMMVVDYDLARQLMVSVDAFFCSPAVRRYFFWTVNGYVEPQTKMAQLYFSNDAPDEHIWADFVLSNYEPLKCHQALFGRRNYEAWIENDALSGIDRTWRIHFYRGEHFGLATHESLEPNHYVLPSGGTHDIIGCYIQSDKGASNHVVPYGYNPGRSPKKKRDLTERYFSYKNVAFVQHSGVTKAVWAGGGFQDVPIRLFYYKDFHCELEKGWAFLSDGVCYVAWAPTIGDPENDTSLTEVSDPNTQGSWVRSTYVPDKTGETAVIEVGDSASYGSYDAFKAAVLSRNARPRLKDGRVSYIAPDGVTLVWNNEANVTINDQAWVPKHITLIDAPDMQGNRIAWDDKEVVFDFDAGEIHGDIARMVESLDADK